MSWGVVLTQPNSERRALEHLTAQAYDCYAPRFKTTTVRAGRKVTREHWLFSRYLFVRIQERWRSIFGTRGVSTLIMNGDKPALMPQHEWATIDAMRLQELNAGAINLRAMEKFYAGQKLHVMDGQFIGLDVIYAGMSRHDRVNVLLSVLGRQTRVEMAASDLAPV